MGNPLVEIEETTGWEREVIELAIPRSDRFLLRHPRTHEQLICIGFNGPLGAKLFSEYLERVDEKQLYLGDFGLNGGGPTLHASRRAEHYHPSPLQSYVILFLEGQELEAFQVHHSEGFHVASFLGEQPLILLPKYERKPYG